MIFMLGNLLILTLLVKHFLFKPVQKILNERQRRADALIADAKQAKEQAEADKLVRDAHLLEEAGCFGLVLEKIPAVLGTRVSQELEIPTIGIGAGGGTDGQVLVIHDMLGINNEFSPRFLRRYADLYTQMMTGVSRYVEDVKSGDFPSEQEQY